MGEHVAEFNDSNFQAEVLDAGGPVLVDFWAPWCGPCRQIAPMIDELASENQGQVKIGKLDTSENPSTAQQYGVDSIPTLMIFKGGEVVQVLRGVQPKARLQEALDQSVA